MKLVDPIQAGEVLDIKDLLRRCMGNRHFAQRIVQTFLEQLTADLNELDAAIAEANPNLAAVIAHRIKGASSNVSAGRLSEAASAIGELAKTFDMVQIGLQAEALRDELERFIETSRQI